ncbi:sugar phosphate isomerase/epimerase family protein [uncultured Enterovirga sp.]|uniref:sugar phosphate isomerase/epimerase family protein n=1 Tax=uncultured Enterovirga sp. TaxID=2026352 RepID=UPI0035CA09BF
MNTYSYTLGRTALATVNHLGGLGFPGVELMMYPGHLWPTETDRAGRAAIRRACEAHGMRIVSVNMPNVDINVAAASSEMREYSLGLLSRFLEVAGDLGAPSMIIGPGKANPLFSAPRELLLGHFHAALERLAPLAGKAGVRLLVENMPFAFLPDARSLLDAVLDHGDDEVGIIYDVANAHYIGEEPGEGLRIVRDRLGLVHVSDTGRSVYRHDPVGMGDVPFATVPPVLAEIGYRELTMLEIISHDPDRDTCDSAERLAHLGYRRSAAPPATAG